MKPSLDLSRLPETHRVAFYGLLFAIARADGAFDSREMEHVYAVLGPEKLSPEAQQQVRAYVVHPPRFSECLAKLEGADTNLRLGILVALVDIALADEILTDLEAESLEQARRALGATSEQLARVVELIQAMLGALDSGADNPDEALGVAARRFVDAGIPASAALFSATTHILRTRGRAEELEALGLALGLGPDLPQSLLVGISAHASVRRLVDSGSVPVQAASRIDRARSAIMQLEQAADRLDSEAAARRRAGDETAANALELRREGLHRLALTRRSALEDLAG
ncbi:MAG: TerB family tellurite resistance protein [Planctomycetes bacterium]|nr:TerB family tellurite resistance protein [Planctomycetota bacterium]